MVLRALCQVRIGSQPGPGHFIVGGSFDLRGSAQLSLTRKERLREIVRIPPNMRLPALM